MTETEAETALRDLLKGRKFTATTTQTGNTAKDGCRYACTLFVDGQSLHTFEWSCGSLYPVYRFEDSHGERLESGETVWPMHDADLRHARAQKGGIASMQPSANVARMQKVIRQHFRPSVLELVASLLTDASMIDNYDGWEDMHEELDGGFTGEDLRNSQANWLLCYKARSVLRKALGDDYADAADLAGQL